jgi:hypothetical protein
VVARELRGDWGAERPGRGRERKRFARRWVVFERSESRKVEEQATQRKVITGQRASSVCSAAFFFLSAESYIFKHFILIITHLKKLNTNLIY